MVFCNHCNASTVEVDKDRREGRTPTFTGQYKGDLLHAQS